MLWNAYAEQYQQNDEQVRQNKFSNLMHCEAKLEKVEAINWNAYAEQFRKMMPCALWGVEIGEK